MKYAIGAILGGIATLIAVLIINALPSQATDWIKLNNAVPRHDRFPELSSSDYYEVASSKLFNAVNRDLLNKNFIKMDEKMAVEYTGHYYKCQEGKTPYLIRAIYIPGGYGKYTLHQNNKDLYIFYERGKSMNICKSAFIVNLDFEPQNIYIGASF